MIAEWLKTIGCVEVSVERFDTQRRRRPDVTAITAIGQPIAFEVQFAPIAVHHWRRREHDLRQGGWESIWLWGYRGAAEPASLELGAAHRELIAERRALWWIDPTEVTIGIGFERWQISGRKRPLPTLPTGIVNDVAVNWNPVSEHSCQHTLSHREVKLLKGGSRQLQKAMLQALAQLIEAWQVSKAAHDERDDRIGIDGSSFRDGVPEDYDHAWAEYRQAGEDGPHGYDNEMPPPALVGPARAVWWKRWAARRRG